MSRMKIYFFVFILVAERGQLHDVFLAHRGGLEWVRGQKLSSSMVSVNLMSLEQGGKARV